MSTTSYMGLVLPTPTTTAGPEWANSINAALVSVDAHDHTSGKGTKVPVSGLNINADLSMQTHALTNVADVGLVSQAAILASTTTSAVYVVNGDLYYNNSSGVPIKVTDGTSIAAATSAAVPTGVIFPYGGSSAPPGFLLCDGSSLLKASYVDLYNTIGTVYGSVDATHFTLPKMQGSVPMGAGTYTDSVSGVITRSLGSTLGAEKHVLTSAQMPIHTHIQQAHHHFGFKGGTSGNTPGVTSSTYPLTSRDASNSFDYGINGSASAADVGLTSDTTATNNNTGGDVSHNNVQPSVVVNYIIKT
jgi:microcystin-dependent protein